MGFHDYPIFKKYFVQATAARPLQGWRPLTIVTMKPKKKTVEMVNKRILLACEGSEKREIYFYIHIIYCRSSAF